ncbi:hypothetical protein [uncultured Ilyobacter sp.]|uniref:hypothetical protein n=1 Tax=uncultured Ilyobacter sp. TaxID=544433 RepID=UPI0029C8E67F|nr:hypothetical protein [uncultured Ilyobacter sp.]
MKKMCKCCNNLKGKKLEKYIEMTGDGKYVCKKCGRFAEDKKNLCSPEERAKTFVKIPVDSSEVPKESKKFEKKKVKKLRVRELREIIKTEIKNLSSREPKEEKRITTEE